MWRISKIVSKGDYNYAVVKEHPNATPKGYVLEHRVVMENHIGRLLLRNEVVHHLNGVKKDNRVENLLLMDSKEHSRQHGYEKGRLFVIMKCPSCGKVFHRARNSSFLQGFTKFNACSNSCRGAFSRKIQTEGLTPENLKLIEENLVSEYVKYHENI